MRTVVPHPARDDLAARWRQVWQDLHLTPPPPVLDELLSAYAGPTRHYHSINHLQDCLRQFDDVRTQAQDPAQVELAIWFHDAVYDTARADNEAQSADWARRTVLDAGGTEETAERISGLIIATDHLETPAGGDAALLCDIDLTILGASPERFDQYERQIRAEYGWVPEQQYRQGRGAILQRLIDRPRVYVTDSFFQLYEDQARSNLRRSLERLAGGGAP